jgi:hypothetical protein
MIASRSLAALLAVCPLALLACRDNQPHVFRAPAPKISSGSPAVAASSSAEVPLGTTGPEARITLVVDGVTGGPIALTDLRGSVAVTAIVARGPGRPASESARVELALIGPKDTTLVLKLDAPAPIIVAHAFQFDVGRGREIRPGAYTLYARIVAGGRVLATSAPIYVVVGGRW